MDVTVDTVYAEACRQLGDAQVRAALLAAEVQRLTAESGRPTPGPAEDSPPASDGPS